jgi:hypothetical protein
MDNFNNQRVHVILDDIEDQEDLDGNYIAAPGTYTTGGVASSCHHDFQPRTVVHEHRQQNHHYNPYQGRFDGKSSSRYDTQVDRGTSSHTRPFRPPMSQGEGQMFCCCFAPSGSIPRCCMDAASCFNNCEGMSSAAATSEDDALQVTELIAFRKAAQMTRTIGAMVIKRQAALINHQLLQLQNEQGQEDYQGTTRPAMYNDARQTKRQRVQDVSNSEGADSRLNRETRDSKIAQDAKTCVNVTSSASNESVLKVAAIQASPHGTNSISSRCSNHGSLGNTGAMDGNVSTASATSTTQNSAGGSSDTNCPDEAAMRIWYQVDRMKRMSMFLKNAQIAQSLLFEELKDCYSSNLHEGGQESSGHENMLEEEDSNTLSHDE